MKDVGSRLRTLRRDRGLSQTELAGDRFTASYVSHLERGRRRISPEALEYFAERLGVEVSTLGDVVESGRAPSAQVTSALVESEAAVRRGDHQRVVEIALGSRAGVDRDEHPELWWVLQHRRVEAHLEQHEFGPALSACRDLMRSPVTAAEPSLHLRVLAQHARGALAVGRLDEAVGSARRAVAASRDQTLDHQLLALRALIAVAAEHDDEHVLAQAQEVLDGVVLPKHPPPAVARAYAELGRAWIGRGRVRSGCRCLDRAAVLMRGRVDLADWSRFCRESATLRMSVGALDGVTALVKELTVSANRAGTAEDRGEALLVAARFAVLVGDRAEAERLLSAADRSWGVSAAAVRALRDELRAAFAGAGRAAVVRRAVPLRGHHRP
ncbi:helix-turn-helix domain-containing protein [Luteipulveratus halotolerans]|uniref:HTH cro/C1-type domain-containing protein n=1 Tax=Luteipulveratus halotolerans TaxID=1631356 RepID=A0A0L6CJP9_9MICO|nr:helix-turn-helix transcriptional regulator [Luteipulveratus halotolerans]KNX38017.1 hypothetical protein VV01_14055 [Luteipulveratus halotolerans]